LRINRYRGWFPVTFSPNMVRGCVFDAPSLVAENECLDVLKDILHRNLADLSQIERYVVQERFGFVPNGEPSLPKTLKGIGRLLGVSKERVRQIQISALRKIRVTLEKRRYAA